MNFVGHAYIARNHTNLIPGNFAGDSYKGNLEKFDQLPSHILNGVKLHRYIDHYTDNSPFIKAVGAIFKNGGVKKVAFIGSDIILDHFITKNWDRFSSKKFEDFVKNVYTITDQNLLYLEADFKIMYAMLKKHKWLFQYHTEEGISMILKQFSHRIGFENDLMNCMKIYQQEKTKIDGLFQDFMVAIDNDSKRFISNLIP